MFATCRCIAAWVDIGFVIEDADCEEAQDHHRAEIRSQQITAFNRICFPSGALKFLFHLWNSISFCFYASVGLRENLDRAPDSYHAFSSDIWRYSSVLQCAPELPVCISIKCLLRAVIVPYKQRIEDSFPDVIAMWATLVGQQSYSLWYILRTPRP